MFCRRYYCQEFNDGISMMKEQRLRNWFLLLLRRWQKTNSLAIFLQVHWWKPCYGFYFLEMIEFIIFSLHATQGNYGNVSGNIGDISDEVRSLFLWYRYENRFIEFNNPAAIDYKFICSWQHFHDNHIWPAALFLFILTVCA